jgi:hypothetical protein
VALVRERTIPTELPPLDREVSANFSRIEAVSRGQREKPYDLNLDFLDRSRYVFFQVAPQFYLPLLLCLM